METVDKLVIDQALDVVVGDFDTQELNFLRSKRNEKLAETDYWVLGDKIPTVGQLRYREALRDITSKFNNARDVIWPTLDTAADCPAWVSMRQARLALLKSGLLSKVTEFIEGIADPSVRQVALIEWDFSNEVRRDSTFIKLFAKSNGLDDSAIDGLLKSAASL